MNLVDLESFVMVADTRSIVAAAVQLFVTQSAVTRRIQNLEQALGVPLFDRNTRPLELTAAGRETYEFALPVLRAVRDLKQAISPDGEPRGDFRFGMPRGLLGDEALMHPITLLREQYPKVRVQAYVRWSDILVERLQDRTLDAAIVLLPEGQSPAPGFVAEGLGTESLVLLAARERTFARNTTLEHLAAESWVLNPKGGVLRQMIESALFERRLPLRLAVEAEGYDLQFALVAKGVGLGLAMEQLVKSSPLRKQMQIVSAKDFKPKLTVWLLHRRDIGRLLPAVKGLRDSVKAYMRAAARWPK